jgi:endonuclease G
MVDDRTRISGEVENIVRDRLTRTLPEIHASLAHITAGNPLAAETEPARRLARLQAKASLSREEATLIASAIDAAADQSERAAKAGKAAGPEAIRGTTLDFVGVAFLERGRRAADAVGRVAQLNERPQGTGFLVAPNLFLTNHHVIESAKAAARFQVQFDYEHDRWARIRDFTSFRFDPELCFVTDDIDGLDFTLIGIGERRAGSRALDSFGFIPLSDANDKHMLGELANVIQHPDGRFKELVLRENHLVARDETLQVLHYVADTEQGSSGSPVFNNDWEPIALHHWGGPWREVIGTGGQTLSHEINEGIRISAIVKHLRERPLAGANAAAVRRALDVWERARRAIDPGVAPAPDGAAIGGNAAAGGDEAGGHEAGGHEAGGRDAAKPRLGADGSITWTFPIEISVRAPLLVPPPAPPPPAPQPPPKPTGKPAAASPTGPAERASWKTEPFDDRGGYEPGFIPGFIVPLPDFSAAPGRKAKSQLAAPGDDPHELRYHHFSIVMNADRRLACFTAVNIDGARIRAVNRNDKTVIDNPTLDQLGVESMGQESAEAAEASDAFRPDRRIAEAEQMNRPFYENQRVPGFPDPSSAPRIARMFQKGHIILRGDPAWGLEEEALAAERDTFFYTNAAPQVGFFNQGSDLNRPGSKGKLRWRAVETYVLRNAVTMRQRINVFAGPVFDEAIDPEYRFGAKVPMRFWKLAVWNDGAALRSIALLADQRPVLKVMPEAFDGSFGAEAFGDEEELARVSEFLSTVQEIESLTGLDFGRAIVEADIRGSGAAGAPVADLQPADLAEPPKRRAGAARKPARRATKSRARRRA